MGDGGSRRNAKRTCFRVLVYEPIPVLAEAIALFLARQPDMDASGVSDFAEFVATVASASLVIFSIHAWGRHVASVVGRVRSASSARVVLLGLDNDPRAAALALAAGADGYVHERAEPTAFLAAVRGVARGETVFVADGIDPSADRRVLGRSAVRLTSRERQVMSLVAQDLTARQVASSLGVSVRTVHGHLQHVYKKLGVHGRLSAVFAAQSEVLVPIDVP